MSMLMFCYCILLIDCGEEVPLKILFPNKRKTDDPALVRTHVIDPHPQIHKSMPVVPEFPFSAELEKIQLTKIIHGHRSVYSESTV